MSQWAEERKLQELSNRVDGMKFWLVVLTGVMGCVIYRLW